MSLIASTNLYLVTKENDSVNYNNNNNNNTSNMCLTSSTETSVKQRSTKVPTTQQNVTPTNLNDSDKSNKSLECENMPVDDQTEFNPQIRWPDLIAQIFIHGGCLYGFYLLFYIKFNTILWFLVTILVSEIGITAGAHRLWSHKSYKATVPLRLILMFLFTIAGQRDAYTWALDHRIHHKYTETDADPHNANRGFFFAHVGWLFLTPHPNVVDKRKAIDMSDLEQDKIVMWQRRYFIPLFALITIALPVLVPWYFWNEDIFQSFWVNFNCRFCITLNVAFFVNSVAHMWGRKPYDKSISPVESIPVAIAALGEGWHNYHHVFPWDYKTGELGDYKYNFTTAIIDAFAKLGWAYDRKVVSAQMVARRAARCGDGTHYLNDAFAHTDQVWGYGDKDIPKEDKIELEAMQD